MFKQLIYVHSLKRAHLINLFMVASFYPSTLRTRVNNFGYYTPLRLDLSKKLIHQKSNLTMLSYLSLPLRNLSISFHKSVDKNFWLKLYHAMIIPINR